MEGTPDPPPPQLISRYWAPGWNSVQSLTRFQEEIGGALRGGDSGVRLVEPRPNGDHEYFGEPPVAFAPRPGAWLLVPLYHLFGSEPLSLETPGILQQAPQPYAAVGPDDCHELGAEDGDVLAVELDGQVLHLPLQLRVGLARGCVGIPFGLHGLPTLPCPVWAKVARLP